MEETLRGNVGEEVAVRVVPGAEKIIFNLFLVHIDLRDVQVPNHSDTSFPTSNQ